MCSLHDLSRTMRFPSTIAGQKSNPHHHHPASPVSMVGPADLQKTARQIRASESQSRHRWQRRRFPCSFDLGHPDGADTSRRRGDRARGDAELDHHAARPQTRNAASTTASAGAGETACGNQGAACNGARAAADGHCGSDAGAQRANRRRDAASAARPHPGPRFCRTNACGCSCTCSCTCTR